MPVSLKHPGVLAWIYVLASVVVGPAVYLGGYSLFTHGVGDYCDAVHGGFAQRDTEFRAAQNFQLTGAGIMLVLGCLVLGRLWSHRRRLRWYFLVPSACMVVVMMLGFLLLVRVSGPSGQSCWPY